MNFFKFLVKSGLAFCFVALVGCAYVGKDKGPFRNHEHDYRHAYLVAPLKVPQNLRLKKDDTLYPLPDNIPDEVEGVVLAPPL